MVRYNIIASGSQGNAVILNDAVLIDCGVPYKQLAPYVPKLKLVLLTHIHGDHFCKRTLRRLAAERPTLRFGCCRWLVSPLVAAGVPERQIDVLKPRVMYGYGLCNVIPFELTHNVPNCGYKVHFGNGKIIYATDTNNLDGIQAIGYDLYMIEANYNDEDIHRRIKEKRMAGQFAYEEQAFRNHLSEAKCTEFLLRNMRTLTRRPHMIITAKILQGEGKKLVVLPERDISRYLAQKRPSVVEIRLGDGRSISAEQRKKIFAIIRDIAIWSGDDPESIRQLLTWDFCGRSGREWFSLSDTDMTTAKSFINYLIEFCFHWSVPTKDSLLNQTDDIGKYLYLCLANRRCAICNKPAEVHHVDRVGMGRDREQIVHVGLSAIALCREHHDEAHCRENDLFDEYHIYGIKLDKYLCERLNLRTE